MQSHPTFDHFFTQDEKISLYEKLVTAQKSGSNIPTQLLRAVCITYLYYFFEKKRSAVKRNQFIKRLNDKGYNFINEITEFKKIYKINSISKFMDKELLHAPSPDQIIELLETAKDPLAKTIFSIFNEYDQQHLIKENLIKDAKDFLGLNLSSQQIDGSRHNLKKIKKRYNAKSRSSSQRHKKNWYLKEPESTDSELVIVNEFLALMLQGLLFSDLPPEVRPKARILMDKGQFYLIVEEIPDFIPLKDLSILKFEELQKKGLVNGAGRSSGFAVIVACKDRNTGNVGLIYTGKSYEMAQIDFLPFNESAEYAISKELLQSLPHIKRDSLYHPSNWFGLFKYRKKGDKYDSIREEQSSYVNEELSDHKEVRVEVNNTLMRFAVLPKSVIEHFFTFFLNDENLIKKYTDYLTKRRDNLINAALENQDFLMYLKNSKNDFEQYREKGLKTFVVTSKEILLNEDHIKDVDEQYDRLMSLVQLKLLTQTSLKESKKTEESQGKKKAII